MGKERDSTHIRIKKAAKILLSINKNNKETFDNFLKD